MREKERRKGWMPLNYLNALFACGLQDLFEVCIVAGFGTAPGCCMGLDVLAPPAEFSAGRPSFRSRVALWRFLLLKP